MNNRFVYRHPVECANGACGVRVPTSSKRPPRPRKEPPHRPKKAPIKEPPNRPKKPPVDEPPPRPDEPEPENPPPAGDPPLRRPAMKAAVLLQHRSRLWVRVPDALNRWGKPSPTSVNTVCARGYRYRLCRWWTWM
ncbi:MAG: hypothetical protein WD688_09355 [Candidatus Binatia bacterium]